ncbi:recombinase family protein [Epibacterium ulvae]|uniref:recombinase family protein n=1 Tax=Epibacterium ulvae TaxID=1156985 RepID=UPI0024915965|nr:recombinase family protein [Epibacterium ulvae]
MIGANKPRKAVIYTRVSGAKQVREGDGLASQENRCREYATYKDYDVVEVFSDDMSGKFERRPAMDRMLAFLRLHPKDSVVVIIDDISRFARDVQAHIKLRQTLSEAGGILESPSIEFGEDSDSRLVEHMLASVAQHQREKNAEQTHNRMKGRMMNSYAVFSAPIGYRYEKTKTHGKLLVRDEPVASIIQEGLEAYASGRIASQAELKRFFDAQPAFPKELPNGQIRQQKVSDMIARVIYAGYIEHDPWGVTRRKGYHEPIISLATFEKIQERKNARPLAPARKDINLDFPMRGFVSCGCCGGPMTACWSQSRNGIKHPYYLCHTKGCDMYRKSLRRADVEGAVEDALQNLRPSQSLFEIAASMLKHAWDLRLEQQQGQKAEVTRQIKACEKQIAQTLDKIVASNSATVVAAFEKRIEELEREKQILEEKRDQSVKPKRQFKDVFEPAMEFL